MLYLEHYKYMCCFCIQAMPCGYSFASDTPLKFILFIKIVSFKIKSVVLLIISLILRILLTDFLIDSCML